MLLFSNSPNWKPAYCVASSRCFLRVFWLVGLFVLYSTTTTAIAQQTPLVSGDGLWTAVSPDRANELESESLLADGPALGPKNYRLFELDVDAMRARLSEASSNESDSLAETTGHTVVTIPLPNGNFQKFSIVETPLFAPELAAKFPNHKAYRGRSIDGPASDLALEISPKGLSAQIRGPAGTIIVDPFANGDQDNLFASFDKKDFRRTQPERRCLLPQQNNDDLQLRQQKPRSPLSFGGELRTYRLAVAATGEYTHFHGGTIADALAAIQRTINRVNQIYEAELSIRFQLVGDNDKIIYVDAANDPFDNSDAQTLINQSQTEIDREIGNANYDIGHTFSTGAGGLAGLGSVGQRGRKALGVTGSSSPEGDPYDVDYVAHEIGHQFNANHTFNGVANSCGGNRNAATAYEPGSGSTILAYAGICGPDNLQNNSNAYFHFSSLEEIGRFVSSDPNQPNPTQTGNKHPVVSGGSQFVIPKETPFLLQAMGSDPDHDTLTYTWEEEDLGPGQGLSEPDNGASPLFRSVTPTPDMKRRIFPRLANILSGVAEPGRRLPSAKREMMFRATVRDNRPGGGAFSGHRVVLNIEDSAGPFRLTEPAAGFVASGYLLAKWDVANTNKPPINTKFVNIRLSVDGGQTFGVTLASDTPNDGIELLQLPQNVSGSTMRLKVEASDNIYFAISPENFEIVPFTKTFAVVRHAETVQSSARNPDLSQVGKSRASHLSAILFRHGQLSNVFSTDFRRTRATAQPSARRIANQTNPGTHKPIFIYSSVPQLTSALDSLSHGSQVLVVGHSNTVPQILRAFDPSINVTIPTSEHDNLFLIAESSSGVRLNHLKYTPNGNVRPAR